MGANRVGGVSPGDPKGPESRAKEQQHLKRTKVEKVRRVDEAENEGTRKKFRKFMDEDEKPEKTAREPSPFETGFHKAEKEVGSIFHEITHPIDDLEQIENKAISSPEKSPPPNVNAPREETSKTSAPLPRSHEFWEETSSSSEKKPKIQETKEVSESPQKKKAKEQVSLSQETDALTAKKGAKKIAKEKQEGITVPLEEEKKIKSAPSGKITPEEEAKTRAPVSKKAKEKERALSPLHPEALPVDKKKLNKDDDAEGKQGAKTPNIIELTDPSQAHMPPSVVPLAQAATTQATSYLNSETNPLFFQMVGTIYVMTGTPGINRTEIALTSPSFSNSKFFGSKIIIEKYATAPDSLNIRLTGPDEAVQSFNQNISNLYAAFQNGTFDFRIGRITAEYSADRPVFKRRDREGKSGGGDFSGEKK